MTAFGFRRAPDLKQLERAITGGAYSLHRKRTDPPRDRRSLGVLSGFVDDLSDPLGESASVGFSDLPMKAFMNIFQPPWSIRDG
jgi:hypothetical protein